MENCSYCFGCYGLHNASYVIHNIQYSPEAYAEEIKNYTHQYGLFLFSEGKEKSIKRDMFLVQSEGCFGDLLYNSKDALFCYDCFATNSKYSTSSGGATDAYDTDHVAYGSTWAYESVSSHGSHIGFVEGCRESQFLYYCKDCHACISCFGCVGLRNKQYCIGNKQYSKQEYERLVGELIEHMQATGERGEFFPHTVSCYGYNETYAQEAFPLSYEEALLRGYSWQEKNYDPVLPEGVHVIDRSVAPGDIEQMSDQALLQMVFLCSSSRRPYRLTPQELTFYRKFSLPLPREHPDVRHDKRVASRPGRTLHLRTCTFCTKDIVSIYPETHEHNVYCEDCYTKEVYG